jgi:cephalosporin hydroxylase
MKLILDTDEKTLTCKENGTERTLPLYSKESFEEISRQWVRVGWNEKYQYSFSWMGRPVIQLPEDMIRMQEAIWEIKPDVIIETGVAHGGSLIYYSSLCKAMDKGRVIGIDIEIRPHNREAIEEHPMFDRIDLIEGSSTAPETIEQVKSMIKPDDVVLVILDSDHSKQHVLDELKAYHDLVTPQSYIVATDGIMFDLHDVPRGVAEWDEDNPVSSVREFIAHHPEFEVAQPAWPFNESELNKNISHWPEAWLKKTA